MIEYSRPRGSIHDLVHISNLSSDRTNVLCVSDRTLYILQNYAEIDVNFAARYAVEFGKQGYTPVSEKIASYWELFKEVTNNFSLEITDMSCDIVAALNQIKDAINDLAMIQQSSTSVPVCCSDVLASRPYYDSDPSSGSPSNKCTQAWSFALTWKRDVIEFYRVWSRSGTVTAGWLAEILAELNLPAGIILEIASSSAELILPVLESELSNIIDDMLLDIVCAIYNASDTEEARANIDLIIQGSSLSETAKKSFSQMFSNMGLAPVFMGTFPEWSGAPSNCDSCSGVDCGVPHFLEVDEVPVGSGDLTPNGEERWLTGYQYPDGSWQIAFALGNHYTVTITELENFVPEGFVPDFRSWIYDAVCNQISHINIDPLVSAVDVPVCAGVFSFSSGYGANVFRVKVRISSTTCIPQG